MPSQKTERELLEEINYKLSEVVGLLSIQGKDLDTQLRILDSLGFTYAQTGALVGMKADAVRMRLSRKANR